MTSETRTLAVLRNSLLGDSEAVANILARINEAGLQMLDQRLISSDEAASLDLGSDPVMVYVLEHDNAVQAWKDLMGGSDTETNSLRAQYGIDNFAGPPTSELAEQCIETLFPHLIENRDTYFDNNNVESDEQTQRRVFTVDEADEDVDGQYNDNNIKIHARVTSDLSQLRISPTLSQTQNRDNTASPFKARPMPKLDADVKPRMSRAAALRLGLEDPKQAKAREKDVAPLAPDMITPGVNQRPLTEAEIPKSLAAPVIAPRETRASAFRTGRDQTTPQSAQKKRETRDTSQRSQGFEGLPGFKRKPSISSFTSAPVAQVKPTKASLLRQGKDSANITRPQSSMASPTAKVTPIVPRPKTAATPSTPRRQSIDSVGSTRQPSIQPRPTRASQLRCGKDNTTVAPKTPTTRRSSVASNTTVDSNSTTATKQDIFLNTPGHKRRETIQVPSLINAPTIAPRGNRSAELRKAKDQANKLAAEKKPIPSSARTTKI